MGTAITPTVTVGQAYLPLFHLHNPVILVEGNRGSGKTRAILTVLMCRALQYRGSRWALWRSTRTRLTETVLNTLEQEVFPAFGLNVPGLAGAENRHSYRLPNGSSLIAEGMDDILRGGSAGFAGGYLNEGVELGILDDALGLIATLREATVPPELNQLIIDTNPAAPGHWLNQKAEKIPDRLRNLPTCRADYDVVQEWNRRERPMEVWPRLLAGHEDNPGYFDLEAWKYLPRGARYIKTTLEGLTGHLRQRWLMRRWSAAEGAVWPEFTDDLIVPATEFPAGIPSSWPVICGYDPGMGHDCAWLWFAVAPNNHLYIVDEIVAPGIALPELAQRVKQTNADRGYSVRSYLGDPQYIFARKQETGKDTRQLMAEQGIKLTGWPLTGGNMDAMVHAVRNRFLDKTLHVFSRCARTIASIQGWSYKRDRDGRAMGGTDRYEEESKDAADVIRGVVASRPAYTNPPMRLMGQAADAPPPYMLVNGKRRYTHEDGDA